MSNMSLNIEALYTASNNFLCHSCLIFSCKDTPLHSPDPCKEIDQEYWERHLIPLIREDLDFKTVRAIIKDLSTDFYASRSLTYQYI